MVLRKILLCVAISLGMATGAKSQSAAQLGNAAFEEGRYTEAVTHFRQALEAKPTFAAYVNLGHAYMRLQQWADAVASYEAAIDLDAASATTDVGLFLGQAYYQMKQYDEALNAFLETGSSNGGHTKRLWIARCLIELEQWLRAKSVLSVHLGEHPKDMEALELLAHVLGRIDDGSGVIDVYRELLATDPNRTTYRIALANALALDGQNQQAIVTLELAWRIDCSATEQANRLLGDLYLAEQMPFEAASCYGRAIRLMDQPHADDYFRLATAYFQAGEYASATEALTQMRENDPTDSRADLYLGHIAIRTGHSEEAERHFDAALAKNPVSTEAIVALAQMRMEQQEYEQAAARFTQALQAGDRRPEVHCNHILALLHLPNRLRETKTALRNALAQYPSDPQLQTLLDRYVRQRSTE